VVSIDREGHDDHPARDAGAVASRRFPPLLALEISDNLELWRNNEPVSPPETL
jgi:hypothetical protein